MEWLDSVTLIVLLVISIYHTLVISKLEKELGKLKETK